MFHETIVDHCGTVSLLIQFLLMEPPTAKPIQFLGDSREALRNFPDDARFEASGAFRVIYLATLPDQLLVLHAFQKKAQQTAQKDIDLAAKRLKTWKNEK